MNWRVVVWLGSLGVFMGIATIFGLSPHVEMVLWVVMAFVSSYVLARFVTQKLVLHGMSAGALMGAAHGILQMLFFDLYLVNNPTAAKGFVETEGIKPRMFVFVVGAITGIVYGAIVGGMGIIVARMLKRYTHSHPNFRNIRS